MKRLWLAVRGNKISQTRLLYKFLDLFDKFLDLFDKFLDLFGKSNRTTMQDDTAVSSEPIGAVEISDDLINKLRKGGM